VVRVPGYRSRGLGFGYRRYPRALDLDLATDPEVSGSIALPLWEVIIACFELLFHFGK
jgi:hypothetical protein